MAAPKKLDYLLLKICKTLFLESSTLKIGLGALQLTTQAPETLIQAKKCLFLAIFWQKMRLFGDGVSKRLDNLLQKLAKHVFLSPAPSK